MITLLVIMVVLLGYIVCQLHNRLTNVEEALSFQIKLSNLQSALLSVLLKDEKAPIEENTEA
jgi:hypothetical protein